MSTTGTSLKALKRTTYSRQRDDAAPPSHPPRSCPPPLGAQPPPFAFIV